MDSIIIKQIDISDEDYQQVYDLRDEILRKPIGLSLKDEDLSADRLDIILAAWDNDRIVGCVMLHPTQDSEVMKLRQMAVAKNWQGKGVGKKLVLAAEELLRTKQFTKIVLHARITAEGFYKGLGYRIVSEVFSEVGIPHVIMEKEI